MIWWINYDFNWVRWLDEFHEHKISNTGWVWNGDERERSGTEQNRKECSTFLNLRFLDQKWSKDLESALAKLRGLCKYLANVYNLHSHVYGLHLSNLRTKKRQENQCNEASRLKKSSALSQHKIWRSLLAIWICYIAAKTTTSLWDEMKGKTRKMQSD